VEALAAVPFKALQTLKRWATSERAVEMCAHPDSIRHALMGPDGALASIGDAHLMDASTRGHNSVALAGCLRLACAHGRQTQHTPTSFSRAVNVQEPVLEVTVHACPSRAWATLTTF
jgi:hypothetical protein